MLSFFEGTLDDHARASRVTAHRQVYELVSDRDIQSTQAAILREVEPQIKELIALAEADLTEMQRRERSLFEQVERQKHQNVISVPLSAQAPSSAPSATPKEVAQLQARYMALQTEKEWVACSCARQWNMK